jgi:hypothetical protein
MRRSRLALIACLAAILAPATAATAAEPPPIRHVFIIVLENENASSTFGANSKAPYLAKTLRGEGAYVENYYATVHNSLGNYVALVSGQGPSLFHQADCPVFLEFVPGTLVGGQAFGQGCVYPSAVKTIADQLTAKDLHWGGFMQDMGNSATEAKTCRHPAIGQPDDTETARRGDQYAARHNPFVYFHSIIDSPDCAKYDVPLELLPAALKSAATTPNYTFITPNLCEDGHDSPCVDGRPGGLVSANKFLETWVPRILASPAYKQDGLLIVTFDEAEGNGSDADSSACCNEQPGLNSPSPGALHPGPGGGKTGAVMLSPFIRPGTHTKQDYNHYSLLRSIEDLFRLQHLGYAAQAGLQPFGQDIYTCSPPALPAVSNGVLPRGSVITRLRRSGRTVRLETNQAATLRIRVQPRGRRTALTGSRSTFGCRNVVVRLPKGHGRVTVRAAVSGFSERRSLSY